MRKHLLLLFLLFVCTHGMAQTFSSDGLEYEVISRPYRTVKLTSVLDGYDIRNGLLDIPEKVMYEGLELSVTEIGKKIFSYRTNQINSVFIPKSITKIEDDAFSYYNDKTYISKVYISDLVAWMNISFGNRTSNPITKSGSLYLNGSLLKNVVVPSSITSIKDYVFSGCSGLTSITIPNSVTSIRTEAFSGCSGLTSITIPNSVTDIYHQAFQGCSGLTSISIPNSVTDIYHHAFQGCSGLTSITIPSSVRRIGGGAFEGCTDLGFVNAKPVTPSSYFNIDYFVDLFPSTVYHQSVLIVPQGSFDAYASAKGWDQFFTIVEEGNGHYVNVKVGQNGKLTIANNVLTAGTHNVKINNGAPVTITITPDAHYELESLIIDGKDVTADVKNGTYSLGVLTSHKTISASFKIIKHTMTVSNTGPGDVVYGKSTIYTNSSFTIDDGSDVSLTITPYSGCKISSLIVDGKNVTAAIKNNTYVISSINKDMDISVTFKRIFVNFDVSAYGCVTVEGNTISNGTKSIELTQDGKFSFTITPNEGYQIKSVVADGKDITDVITDITKSTTLSYNSITSDKNISVTFEKIMYTMSFDVSAYGCVTVEGETISNGTKSIKVTNVDKVPYTITPDVGCMINSVVADGKDITYLITDMTKSSTLYANNIKSDRNYIVKFSQMFFGASVKVNNAGGSLFIGDKTIGEGSQSFNIPGGKTTITIAPDKDYKIKSLIVNGNNVTADIKKNTYEVTVLSAMTITATFEKIVYATCDVNHDQLVNSADVVAIYNRIINGK